MIISGMNTMEAVPQVVSWPTRIVVKTIFDYGTRSSMQELGIPVDPDLEFIHIHKGRAYAIVDSMAASMMRIPGFKLEAAGVEPEVVWPYLPDEVTRPLTVMDRVQGVLIAVGMLTRLPRVIQRLGVRALAQDVDRTNAWTERIAKMSSAQELASVAKPLLDSICSLCTAHALSAMMLIQSWTQLEQACAKIQVVPSLVVADSGGIVSSRVVSLLHQLAAEAAQCGIDLEAGDAWTKLNTDPVIKEILDEFVETCGHRGFNELELATPKFKEDPDTILVAMRAQTAISPHQLANEARQAGWSQVPESQRKRIARRVEAAQKNSALREVTKDTVVKATDVMRQWCLKAGATMDDPEEVWLMTIDEIVHWLQHGVALTPETLDERRANLELWRSLPQITTVYIDDATGEDHPIDAPEEQSGKTELGGMVVSRGVNSKVKGRAVVVLDPHIAMERIQALQDAGESTPVLITRVTNVAWTATFGAIGGIVTEVGGMASHAAIVAREYGIPALVGATGAVACVPDGEVVELDCEGGVVRWVG